MISPDVFGQLLLKGAYYVYTPSFPGLPACPACPRPPPVVLSRQVRRLGRVPRALSADPTPQSRPLLPSFCKQMAIVLSGGVYHWRCGEVRGWGAGHNAWEQRPSRPRESACPVCGVGGAGTMYPGEPNT